MSAAAMSSSMVKANFLPLILALLIRRPAVFNNSDGPEPQSRWTYIADRESDIYEVFGEDR